MREFQGGWVKPPKRSQQVGAQKKLRRRSSLSLFCKVRMKIRHISSVNSGVLLCIFLLFNLSLKFEWGIVVFRHYSRTI